MSKLLPLCLLLVGCATERLPTPRHTLYVYSTKEGVTVLVEPSTGESVGYSFHVDEVYTHNTPTEGEE